MNINNTIWFVFGYRTISISGVVIPKYESFIGKKYNGADSIILWILYKKKQFLSEIISKLILLLFWLKIQLSIEFEYMNYTTEYASVISDY